MVYQRGRNSNMVERLQIDFKDFKPPQNNKRILDNRFEQELKEADL